MTDLVATYYFRPKEGVDPKWAANAIAEEQTTGTWTSISTGTKYMQYLDGRVESLEKEGLGYISDISYPAEIFETGNIPQYFSVVAGNLFGLSKIAAVRLLDIDIPKSLVPFHGPRFGIEGIREIIGTTQSGRPHVGTIIKPKVGLNPKDTAEVAYQAAIGGVDLIKDDETLTNQSFCLMEDRIPLVMERLDQVADDTGRTVLYAVNISTSGDRIAERAEQAVELGANMVMVDAIVCGLDAVRVVAEDTRIRVPIHVHRTMHGAITRNREHGIAMRPYCRFIRMLGGDQLHTGTVSGKMDHDTNELIKDNMALTGTFYGLKETFPVASGGLHPGGVWSELQTLGTDLVLQAGGGIHGHPRGTAAGAMAMRQAVDAFMEDIPLEEYAQTHEELQIALATWGSS